VSDTSPNYRAELLAYIEQKLPVEQLKQFETQMIDDEAFSAGVAFVEQELLEDYAGKTLTLVESSIVEPWVLASPRRLEHVRLTHLLMSRKRSSAPSAARQRLTVFRSRPFFYAAAVAASVLIASLFVLRYKSATSSIDNAPSQQTASVRQSSTSPVDTILLTPERTRGSSSTPLTYKLHPGSQTRLQIVVPDSNKSDEYRVILQNETSGETESFFHLARLKTSDIAYVELTVAKGSLKAGNYTATLQSRSGSLVARFIVSH